MTTPRALAEVGPELARIVKTIESAGELDAALWLGTILGALGFAIWIVVAADPADHVRTAARLWPLVLIWIFGLLLRHSMTTETQKEVVRADMTIAVAARAAQERRWAFERQLEIEARAKAAEKEQAATHPEVGA
jgi:hypothetical protein